MTRSRRINGGLWLMVVILGFLIVASFALYYSLTGQFTLGDVNVIALMPGEGGKGETPTLKPAPGDTTGEQWEVHTDIDLFQSTYTNKQGEVIVKSEDGAAVIAPGTSNSYRFSLKNTGHLSMDFKMTLSGLFALFGSDLPFEIRLRSGGRWLAGNEETWVTPDSLSSLEIKDTVGAGRYVNYVLEWRWPYEGSSPLLSDLNDTMLGDHGTLDDLNFDLKINTVATITEGAVTTSTSGWVILTDLIPAPVLYAILALLVLAILAGLIGVLFFRGNL